MEIIVWSMIILWDIWQDRRLVLRYQRKRNGKWICAAVFLMMALTAGGCIRVRQTQAALQESALKGDADGLAAFQGVLDKVRSEASGYSYQRSDDWSVLDELQAGSMEESAVGMVKELMESTYDMDVIMEEGLAHLEKICTVRSSPLRSGRK